MLSLKAALVSGGALIGAGGLLFGGSAVSTAWTTSGTGTFAASSASVGTSVSGSVALINAVPGDESQLQPVKLTNNSSTAASWAISFSGGNPSLNAYTDVYESISDATGVNPTDIGTVAQLEAGPALASPFGNVSKGFTANVYYALGLAANAPESVSGLSSSVTYTVTGTALSDTNQNNFPGDTNSD